MHTDTLDNAAAALCDREVAALLGVSVRSVHQRAADDPTFPASIRIGRSRRWLRDEVVAWLRERAPRDQPSSCRRA